MEENKDNDFDKNLKEIKDLSTRLKKPLEKQITILYYDDEKKKIKYKGEYKNDKYEGRGILYNTEGKIEFNGYFSKGNYDGFGNLFSNNKLKYEGYFSEGKKNGKGLLYYYNSEKIYFNGIFDMNNYIEGIEFDPHGVKLYKGLFMNNKPKEGKNIKYYNLNGDLEYEGDFLEGQYHGYGTLNINYYYDKKGIFSEFNTLYYIGEFKNNKCNGQGKIYKNHFLGKYLFYEGNFDNDYFSGNGKMYYQNKEIFYEGQFEKNKIIGKGIKYYKNGKIKFQGNFSNNNCIQGIYYSPDEIKLYEGEFKNEIPLESENIIIYDNNTNKIYEGEIHNGLYEGKGIEYCPLIKDKILFKGNFKNNEYILPDFDINRSNNEKYIKGPKIILLSHGDIPGKTCLLNRISGVESFLDTLATIGSDKIEIPFENNNLKYKLIFWDTAGQERFRSIAFQQIKTSNMVIYLFDISKRNGEISLDFINRMKEEKENIQIYIVGNKLDLLNEEENMELINKEYFERFRSKAVEAMNKNLIDKYFEISVKTGKGIERLMNSIKMDYLIYLSSFGESGNNSDVKKGKKIIKKKKEKCIIF